MGKYIELTEKTFDENIKEGVVLVDFWAPWCGPCRMLAPIIEELAKDNEGKVKICKVNTDEENNLPTKYQIRSIPTMLIFKDGEVVHQMIGRLPKVKIQEELNKFI